MLIGVSKECGADQSGYGASDKPKGSESHVEYSKREMANDQVQVM
jgi:haloacetate dehalogenase